MEDIFKLNVVCSLVILIACGSADQEVYAGDEPLGLITALMCAGAASVIGTLWNIETSAARTFSEKFFTNIGNVKDQEFTNLAIVVQKTIISMKNCYETRLLYHWAPFVLHGSLLVIN